MERQRAETYEISSGEDNAEEDDEESIPTEYNALCKRMNEASLEDLIRRKWIQKCDSCDFMCYVKDYTPAGRVYQAKCQRHGCAAFRATKDPFLSVRFQAQWP